MAESHKSYLYAALIFFAGFTSVAVDSGIIPHFETIGSFFRTDGNSMLTTLTAFNATFVVGLLYGSVFSGPKSLWRSFLGTAVAVAVAGVMSTTTGLMPVWLGAWSILGFSSGLLSHLAWVFTLNVGHSSVVMTRMISAQLSSRPVGIALGVPLFTLLASFHGWSHSLLLFCLAAALGSAMLGALSLRPAMETTGAVTVTPPEESLLKHYKTIGNPVLLSLILGNFFYGMSYLGLYGVLGIVVTNLYGYSPKQIGYLYAVLGALEGVSTFVSPILVKRFEQIKLVRFFALFSSIPLVVLFGASLNQSLFASLLVLFAFSARQLIFASFKAAGEAIAVIAPTCPIGTFVIMAAWSGFSLSTYLLERSLGAFGMAGCAAVLIATYLAGLFFFLRFFEHDFTKEGAAA